MCFFPQKVGFFAHNVGFYATLQLKGSDSG